MMKPVQMMRMIVELPLTKIDETKEQRLNTFSSHKSVRSNVITTPRACFII